MFETEQEITIAVLSGTGLILLLVFIIIIAAINYRAKQREYQLGIQQVKEEQQREILKASLEVREQTLQNVAQEIHDNVGQVLSLVKLNLNIANQSMSETPAREKLTDSIALTSKVIQDLRDLSKTLNAEYIKTQKLSSLIKQLLDQLKRTGDYKVSMNILGEENPLKAEDRIIVYRMIQEITNNIIKHAESTIIEVKMSFQKPDLLEILIADNGKGFNTKDAFEGNGLHNLKYRSNLINAKIKIDSQLGKGTNVVLKLKTHA